MRRASPNLPPDQAEVIRDRFVGDVGRLLKGLRRRGLQVVKLDLVDPRFCFEARLPRPADLTAMKRTVQRRPCPCCRR